MPDASRRPEPTQQGQREATTDRSSSKQRSTSASVLKKCGLILRPSPRKSVHTSRSSSSWQIAPASSPTRTFTTPPRSSRERGCAHLEPGLVGPRDHVVGQLTLPRADPLDPDLRDHVDASLREEEHRRRRRAVFQSAGRRVVREVLEVERERLLGREPAGDGGFQGRQHVAARVEEHHARAAAHPLQRAGRVEVAPEGVKVERHDAEAVVVVDERQRAAIPGDRAHGGRVDDRARPVEHSVQHHDRRPFVDRLVVGLDRDREPVRGAQPHDLGARLRRPGQPDMPVGREVELAEDHAVAVRPEGRSPTRSSRAPPRCSS